MKVLIASLNYAPEPTGIGPYSSGLAEGLQALGHDVQVITGIPHYPQWTNYTDVHRLRTRELINGVEVLRLGHYVPPGGVGIKRGLLELSFAAAAMTAPLRKPDVIVTVSPSLAASAALVARSRLLSRGARIPILVWVQDLYSAGLSEFQTSGVVTRLARAVESAVLNRADGVVVIHERFGRLVRDGFGVRPDRTITLRNWTHVDFEDPQIDPQTMRAKRGWGDKTVVLHAGNMGRKQGLTAVVDAARVAQRIEKDILFVLLGNGSERDKLMADSANCPNIEFIGTCPDEEFKATLRAADILLINELVGVREMALPSKLTSYFAAGRPVVAAVAGDGVTAEELVASKAGVTVPPGEPHRLISAIEEIAADPELAQTLGANGAAYASDHLTPEAVLRGFSALLGSTRTRRRASRTAPRAG